MTSKLLSILVLVATLFVARAAHAQETSVDLVPQDDPKKDLPPDLVVKVVSGSAPPALEKLSLVQTDNPKGEIELKATDLKTYAQGDETLGLVVVIEAHLLWIGNDSYTEDTSKYEGVYKTLVKELDKLNAAGPAGSKAAIVSYGSGATLRWQGELKDLTGDKIGTQKDLTNTSTGPVVNRDLVAGVDEATTALNKMGTSRKVMLVIGDGVSTNQSAGDADLADRSKKLAKDGITVFAIYVQAPIDLDGNMAGFNKLTKKVYGTESLDGVGPKIGVVVDEINDRYYVRFPGYDAKLKRAYDWDEKPHAFTLKIDKEELELEEVVLAPKWIPPHLRSKGGGFPWLAVIGGLLGAVLLVVVGIAIFKKKPAPEPEPVVAAPVAAPAPAPAAAPMKTQMWNIGGDDGFPVVGWIVPLNGPNQFQTFKLHGGATKIGTQPPAHIVINDGFMSTEHCQIVMSPQGFVLVDGGSTNGTYVNERKVDKHELVDNDVITMGKTNFRFKSIN